MEARNSEYRYGSVAIAFHWLIALLVIGNICVGLYMGDLPRSDPMKFQIFQLHKSIGLLVLVCSVLRVVWRVINPVPPIPRGMPGVTTFAARATHFVFYVLIVAVPLAGWIMVSASPLGNGTQFFGLFTWPNLPFFTGMTRESLRPAHELFESAHVLAAWAMIVLIPIHVLAALYHHFIRRDDVLKRMLPGTHVVDRA
jgi:cytochrome b561